MICSGEVGGDQITLQGQTLKAQEAGTPLMVMGLPVGPRVTGAEVLEALMERARKAFRPRWKILHSRASVGNRARVLDRVCFGSMSWTIGAIHTTVAGLKMINQLHMEFLVSVLGGSESFVDYRQRVLRGATIMLHMLGKERWNSIAVRLSWRYIGHRASNRQHEGPGCAGTTRVKRGSPADAATQES